MLTISWIFVIAYTELDLTPRNCTVFCSLQPNPVSIYQNQLLKMAYLPSRFKLTFDVKGAGLATTDIEPYNILSIVNPNGEVFLTVSTLPDHRFLTVQYEYQFTLPDCPGFGQNFSTTWTTITIMVQQELFSVYSSAYPSPLQVGLGAPVDVTGWEFSIFASQEYTLSSGGFIRNINITGAN